jgi:hypothetical protein
MDGPPDFNQAELIERGWTRTAIRRILGEPDRRIADQAFAETKYLASRVYCAEQAGATRYRRKKRLSLKRRAVVPTRWFPHAPDLPLHDLDPSDWLPKVKLRDLDVPAPWTVERLIFTSDDGVLYVCAHHSQACDGPVRNAAAGARTMTIGRSGRGSLASLRWSPVFCGAGYRDVFALNMVSIQCRR